MEHCGYLQVKNGITSENYGTFGISIMIEYSELFAKALELTLKFSLIFPLQSCCLQKQNSFSCGIRAQNRTQSGSRAHSFHKVATMLSSLLFTCVYIVCKMVNIARYQASTAVYFRPCLFRDVWRLRLVVVYRRLGTQYWPHPLGACRRGRCVFPIRRLPVTNLRRVSCWIQFIHISCKRAEYFSLDSPTLFKVEVQTCRMFTIFEDIFVTSDKIKMDVTAGGSYKCWFSRREKLHWQILGRLSWKLGHYIR